MTAHPNCEDCGRRPGTEEFYVDMLALTHGGVATMLCKFCVLSRQIKHAAEQAARLPGLLDEYSALMQDELLEHGLSSKPS